MKPVTCTQSDCESLRVWKWRTHGRGDWSEGWSWGCDFETAYPFATREDALAAALAAHASCCAGAS